MESLDVNPQVRPNQTMGLWSPDLSSSTNIRLICSSQIIHLKHNKTKFQIFDKCFPNQSLHPNKRPITLSGNTQETLNDLKTKLHSESKDDSLSPR